MFAELDQNFQKTLTEALFLELYRYARISLFTRDYYILTNIEKEETTNNLQSIITAEQLRKERHQPSSADIKTLIDNGEIN